MGLDSVELIISFENYFNIQISDIEAENIRTVQDSVNCIAKQLQISEHKTALKEEFFQELKAILIELQLATLALLPSYKISNFLNPNDKNAWKQVSEKLELQIPLPYSKNESVLKGFFNTFSWEPRYEWSTLTVEQFITAVIAYNYEKLIDKKNIKNHYEILIAVIAITTNNLGLDVYEVQPEKAFADDFGID